MRVTSLLVVLQALVVYCSQESTRKARLFSFNTFDDDIRIDLDFSVPFISIPVKKTVDAAFGNQLGLPTININPTSLALAGVIVVATTVFVPHLLKNYAIVNPNQRYSKLLQAADFETEELLGLASKMLSESRSVRGCALKVACLTSHMPADQGIMKIWDHLLKNRLLSSMVNSTAVEDAILSGQQGRDCSTYTPCPLHERHLPMIVNNVAFLTKRFL